MTADNAETVKPIGASHCTCVKRRTRLCDYCMYGWRKPMRVAGSVVRVGSAERQGVGLPWYRATEADLEALRDREHGP